MRIRNQNECWFLLQSQLVWICLHNLLFNSIVYEKWDSESLYESSQSNSHMGQFTSLCHMSQPHAVPSPHWTIWQMVLLVTTGAKEKMRPDQCKPVLVSVTADRMSRSLEGHVERHTTAYSVLLLPHSISFTAVITARVVWGSGTCLWLTYTGELHRFIMLLLYGIVIKTTETLSRETSQGRQSEKSGSVPEMPRNKAAAQTGSPLRSARLSVKALGAPCTHSPPGSWHLSAPSPSPAFLLDFDFGLSL